MPIRINYDEPRKLLTANVIGAFSFEETQQAIIDLMEHPSLSNPRTCILWDMTDAAQTGLDAKQVQALIGTGQAGMARLMQHPRAVVVKHDLHFGIAREYDVYQTPSEEKIELFRTREAALRFLGVPENVER